jgi:hypothetical protein
MSTKTEKLLRKQQQNRSYKEEEIKIRDEKAFCFVI